MGAVMGCGPKKGSMRYGLVAIADNADDYGFACPSIETIADKACCDERTAMRLVQALEREGWMAVRRRVLGGKGSIYFLNLDKLGASVGAKSRKSPLHAEMEKTLGLKKTSQSHPAPAPAPPSSLRESSGDNLSPESVDAPGESGDNPQGGQVKKTAESGDKNAFPILKNRCEPLLNPSKGNTPQPPSKSRGANGLSQCQPDQNESSQPDAEATPRNASGERGASGAGLQERELQEAGAKVMRECNLSDPRLLRVICTAIASFRAKTDDPIACNRVAERMIETQRLYVADGEMMSYRPGMRKFFAHGLWLDRELWPYDRGALKDLQMRANARIGCRDYEAEARAKDRYHQKPDDPIDVESVRWLYRDVTPEEFESAPLWLRKEHEENAVQNVL